MLLLNDVGANTTPRLEEGGSRWWHFHRPPSFVMHYMHEHTSPAGGKTKGLPSTTNSRNLCVDARKTTKKNTDLCVPQGSRRPFRPAWKRRRHAERNAEYHRFFSSSFFFFFSFFAAFIHLRVMGSSFLFSAFHRSVCQMLNRVTFNTIVFWGETASWTPIKLEPKPLLLLPLLLIKSVYLLVGSVYKCHL